VKQNEFKEQENHMIKIVFFAALREQLNCHGLSMSRDNIHTNSDLKKVLANKGDVWQKAFDNQSLLAAVNHDMVNHNEAVNAGDEVAFFPPVTGG
jgi:molybdopterin synthase sulfur carrier subunit